MQLSNKKDKESRKKHKLFQNTQNYTRFRKDTEFTSYMQEIKVFSSIMILFTLLHSVHHYTLYYYI